MTLLKNTYCRKVSGLTSSQEQRIKDFLQGAIYCWCKNRPNEWFSMRDLMGGENYFWEDTPLMELFNKHKNKGKNNDKAVNGAGKDSGWLLKRVVINDKRVFDTKKAERIRKYKWIR